MRGSTPKELTECRRFFSKPAAPRQRQYEALRAYFVDQLSSTETARRFGYDDAQARQIFRDLIDMPANVAITEDEVRVRFHRRAHLPIVLASGLFNTPVAVPWWNGATLTPRRIAPDRRVVLGQPRADRATWKSRLVQVEPAIFDRRRTRKG